jgi:predicted dehydrogenase
MVSQNYRHYPASIAAANLVASGALGRPLEVAVDFRRNALVEGYRYWDIPDPLLADMSIHHFDLMRFALGLEPVEVSCRTWNHADGSPFRADPCGAATILFDGGVVVSYRGSWLSRAPVTTGAATGRWILRRARCPGPAAAARRSGRRPSGSPRTASTARPWRRRT